MGTNLKNFDCCLSPTEMCGRGLVMTECKDTLNLMVGNTPFKTCLD